MTMVSLSCRAFLLLSVFLLRLRAQSLNTKDDENVVHVERLVLHALPKIEVLMIQRQARTNFTGTFHSEYTAGEDSEGDAAAMSVEENEACLSWEVAWPKSGKRLEKFVRIHPATGKVEVKSTMVGNQLTNDEQGDIENQPMAENVTSRILKARHRGKRNIFGTDNRFYIPTRTFARRFPFASVVKVSSGCTGSLVSPRHVLTAAHCIHDQKDYVSRYKDLKVGLIQTNGAFKWYKVSKSYLPTGWLIGNPDIASKFDYALLKLESAHEKPYFKMGISENTTNGVKKRIHFTAFEDDKRSNTLWYRYCRVEEADTHVLYHYCDALPGSSGAGVYLWDYEVDDRAWERRLIGVFSGNRWRYYKEWWKRAANFNAAIRIDSTKYTQICQWMGSYAKKSCKQKYYTS